MKCRHVLKKSENAWCEEDAVMEKKLKGPSKRYFSCSNICSGNTLDLHSFYSVLRGPCRNLLINTLCLHASELRNEG